MLKKWLRCAGTGILCSFAVLTLLMVILPLFSQSDSLFLTFPAFSIYLPTENVSAIFWRMTLLFTCYGVAGASIYCVNRIERIPMPLQCAIGWFCAYIALFVTVWMCDKFELAWLLTFISLFCFAAIWLLRVWRWKSRIKEIDMALPQMLPQGKRRVWNSTVSQFAATACIWLLAAGYALLLILLLCI